MVARLVGWDFSGLLGFGLCGGTVAYGLLARVGIAGSRDCASRRSDRISSSGGLF